MRSAIRRQAGGWSGVGRGAVAGWAEEVASCATDGGLNSRGSARCSGWLCVGRGINLNPEMAAGRRWGLRLRWAPLGDPDQTPPSDSQPAPPGSVSLQTP